MSFPYRGQLAHRRSAARLADSSVGVFCSPQPSFFYLSFLCLSVTTYFRCSGCVIQWQIWRTMYLIKAIFQPILLNTSCHYWLHSSLEYLILIGQSRHPVFWILFLTIIHGSHYSWYKVLLVWAQICSATEVATDLTFQIVTHNQVKQNKKKKM